MYFIINIDKYNSKMEEERTTQHSQNYLESSDEISWIIYGVLSSLWMVVYQSFLIEFLSIPSTVSSRMVMSIVIGIVTLFIDIIVRIIR